jgi:hypothetical protein
VAETTVRRLLCCGFQHTGKVMGQVYKRWWRIRQELNAFPMFEYHVLYPFVTYLLTLPRTLKNFKRYKMCITQQDCNVCMKHEFFT